MHLAAFVDDVLAADHRLTVAADGPVDALRARLAEAIPAAPVTVESGPATGPARLLDRPDGELALALGDDPPPGAALAVGQDLSIRGLAAASTDRGPVLGTVDETTFTLDGAAAAVPDAATLAVAALADETDGGAVHLGVGSLDRAGPDGDATTAVRAAGAAHTNVHLYGAPADDPDALGPVAVHAAAAGELPAARFAVYDGGRQDHRRAALVAVPDGDDYRGFLTFRDAIVEDVAAYLERAYGRERLLH